MEANDAELKNEGEGKAQEEEEEESSLEQIIQEPPPFNELAQCYFEIEDLKLDPTYEEMVIACSSTTSRSLKYLENSLKDANWEIFPDREDFDVIVPYQHTAIVTGNLDSINQDSYGGDDNTSRVSRESVFAIGAASVDWSKKARLTKITPLMVATMNKNHKACKLLIEHGINMQLVDSLGGMNPLLIACENGDFVLFEYLVKNKADINVTNSKGQTPLMISTRHNFLNIICLLLDNPNIDIDKEDLNGMNAFSLACSLGNEEVVNILIAYRDKLERAGKNVFSIDWRDKFNLTPLMKAATFGYYEIVLKLLKFGANPRIRNNFGESALALSWMQENHKICERLIMAKADVNEIDYLKRTPLLKAARHNTDYSILELLLKNGAKTDIADDNGNTPLHHAAIRGSDIVAEFLLNLGADPYAKNIKDQGKLLTPNK